LYHKTSFQHIEQSQNKHTNDIPPLSSQVKSSSSQADQAHQVH